MFKNIILLAAFHFFLYFRNYFNVAERGSQKYLVGSITLEDLIKLKI